MQAREHTCTHIYNMCIHPSQHQSFHSTSWSFSTRTSVLVLRMYTVILTGVTKKGKCENSLREIEFHITISRTGYIVYIIHFFPQTSFPSFSGTATELPTFHSYRNGTLVTEVHVSQTVTGIFWNHQYEGKISSGGIREGSHSCNKPLPRHWQDSSKTWSEDLCIQEGGVGSCTQ